MLWSSADLGYWAEASGLVAEPGLRAVAQGLSQGGEPPLAVLSRTQV